MDEFLYSTVVDALLDWGRTRLLFPGHDSYLKRIENFIFSVPAMDREKELACGIDAITKESKKAKDTLSAPDLITATTDDKIWAEAEDAFLVFDRLVFLSESLDHLLRSYDEDLAEKFLTDLDRIIDELSAWLYCGENFSALRLTVLNDFRRERLANITEEKKYLFPWYHLFVEDMAPLDWLMHNFHLLQQDKPPEDLPEEINEKISLYIAELNHDKALAHALEVEHSLSESIEKAVAGSLAFRLWNICESGAINYCVPQNVENAGLCETALRLITSMPIKTLADRVALVLQTAFCGAFLNNVQRLKAFSWVEQNLKGVTASEVNTLANQIINALRKWIDGKIGDGVFVDTLFTLWIEELSREAESVKVSQAERNAIWNFVEGIMKESSEAYVVPQLVIAGVGEATAPGWKQGMEDWLQKGKDMLVDFIKRNYHPARYRLPSLSESESTAAMRETKEALKPPQIESNLLEMEIFIPADGKNTRLLPPESDSENITKLNELLQYFKRFDTYYYAVLTNTKTAVLERLNAEVLPKRKNKIVVKSIDPATTRIIIGLHPDENTLNKVMTGKITNKDLRKKHKIEVFFISFVPVRKT